jgi:DNA repair exonuclease SbcCD ATPase subunit
MGKFNEASDNIKRLSKQFKGLIEFGEELEKMGSVENHFEEIQVAKTQASKELEKLSGDLEYAKANIEAAKSEAAAMLEDGKAKAEALVKAGEAKAQALLDDAKSSYDQCKQMVDDAARGFEITKAQRQEELSQLNDSIAAKERKLAEVHEALEKIKGKI